MVTINTNKNPTKRSTKNLLARLPVFPHFLECFLDRMVKHEIRTDNAETEYQRIRAALQRIQANISCGGIVSVQKRSRDFLT
jgi:hypothetical protein